MISLVDLFSGPSAPWVDMLAQWFVKGALVLAAAALLTCALRQSAAAAVRHLIWCAALLSLLVLPVLSFVLPAWPVLVPARAANEALPFVVPSALPALSEEHSRLPVLAQDHTMVPSLAGSPAYAEAEPVRVTDRAQPAPASERSAFWAALEETFAGRDGASWFLLVWLAGVAVVLGRLLVAHAGARLLLSGARLVHGEAWHGLAERSAERLGLSTPVRLRWSARITVPLCLGVFRPTVLLPEEAGSWAPARRETVLLHELAHAKRRDVLTHLLAQVACALHWFNPLVWVAARQLGIERERACDDAVLLAGTRATDYAETLLETARSLRPSQWTAAAALAMARRSQLEGRLLAILDARPHRRRMTRASGILALALVAGIVLPLAALTPALAQETPPEAIPPASQDRSTPVTDVPDAPAPQPTPDVRVAPEPDPVPEPFPGDAPDMPVPDETTGEAAQDSLTIEQLIRLRRYGVDAEFIRGFKALGYADLTVEELIDLAKYGTNPDYVAAVREAGLTDVPIGDLMRMAKYGLNASFVRAVREAGYATADVEELIDLAKYGADADFIAEVRAAGLTDIRTSDLIDLAKYGFDGDLVEALNRLGYTGLSVDDLIDMSKYGVDPDLVAAMHELGYTDLTADDLVSLTKYGVDPDFVRTMARLGYADLSADELVDLSKYGVDADLVAALARRGYADLSVDDLVDASKYGVDGNLIEAMADAGLGNLSIDQLADLAKYGVDADYVRELREAGLTRFTAEQLIEMKKHGLDGAFIKSMQDN